MSTPDPSSPAGRQAHSHARSNRPWLRWCRRLVQLAFLAGFFWLFRNTEAGPTENLSQPTNLFFRMDPLVGASAMLAARQIISAFWPAALVLITTVIFGRFFCGWICPLGTLLDLSDRLLRPLVRRTRNIPRSTLNRLKSVRFFLLFVTILTAIFGLQLSGFVDPFALLTRGLTCWVDPALAHLGSVPMTHNAVDPASIHSAAIDPDASSPSISDASTGAVSRIIAQAHLLPLAQKTYHLAITSAILLGIIFLLELIARRTWCRYLCPLGAMLGLIAPFSWLKRGPSRSCARCNSASGPCAESCRMDAFDAAGRFSPESCNLCMDCQSDCTTTIARFTFGRKKRVVSAIAPSAVSTSATSAGTGSSPAGTSQASAETSPNQPASAKPSPVQLTIRASSAGTVNPPKAPSARQSRGRSLDLEFSRRTLLASIIAGCALPALGHFTGASAAGNPLPDLIRPPGSSLDDPDFLDLCIRCGQCLKVCPTNALQPAEAQFSWAGLFSPRLLPRTGYCEYDCRLCGQVCPTGAIPHLSLPAKQAAVMGKAMIDTSRCLPWASGEPCTICEENCPISDKAIHLRQSATAASDAESDAPQQPFIVMELCIGCGTCENKCPVPGPAAIQVRRAEYAKAHANPQTVGPLPEDASSDESTTETASSDESTPDELSPETSAPQ